VIRVSKQFSPRSRRRKDNETRQLRAAAAPRWIAVERRPDEGVLANREFGFETLQRFPERVGLPPGLRRSLGQSKQTPTQVKSDGLRIRVQTLNL
jgi:hypothetical protein